MSTTANARTQDAGLDSLLTVEDVMAALKLSRSAVYVRLTRGELKSVHIGRARRIRQSEVQRFLEGLSMTAKGAN